MSLRRREGGYGGGGVGDGEIEERDIEEGGWKRLFFV
jgi:hypothetical protein